MRPSERRRKEPGRHKPILALTPRVEDALQELVGGNGRPTSTSPVNRKNSLQLSSMGDV